MKFAAFVIPLNSCFYDSFIYTEIFTLYGCVQKGLVTCDVCVYNTNIVSLDGVVIKTRVITLDKFVIIIQIEYKYRYCDLKNIII